MTTAWPWQRLNASNAETHELLVSLLDPKRGELFLDVGTGSGGVARFAVERGCDVVGVDVAEAAVRAARDNVRVARFEIADAQALPFGDEAFDVVASAYGVNFAPSHARAASELARVCRSDGRLGLAVMPPDSRAGSLWSLVREHDGGGGDHPAEWRAELLEPWFELEVHERESEQRESFEPEEWWKFSRQHLGFVRNVVERLDADETERFRARFLEIARAYDGRLLRSTLILGRRR